MNTKLIEDIASAVLYEGYLLYPYRASALKNQQRWNFGVLYPRAYAEQQSGADAWSNQTECLVRAGSDAKLSVRVRFLQLAGVDERSLAVAARKHSAVTEPRPQGSAAQERDITLSSLRLSELAAQPSRLQLTQPLDTLIEVEANLVDRDLYKIRVSVCNTSSCDTAHRDEALTQSLVSTHSIIGIQGGEFVSLLDPPDELRDFTAACQNVGTWPVLVGEDGQRDSMLSSPIILYDYPQIAPESPGALFDGTEIDEILTLRILTLTDDEKREISSSDERARQILERTESMPAEQFMKMHGVARCLKEVQEEMS
jgi:hydrogenase maturation protease